MKFAFRCKHCGKFEEACNAGEEHVPSRCRNCGEGISFTKQGIKLYHPENWEILANCTPERLAAIVKEYNLPELTPDKIERHTPKIPAQQNPNPQQIERTAVDGAKTSNKVK